MADLEVMAEVPPKMSFEISARNTSLFNLTVVNRLRARIKALQKALDETGFDAYLITNVSSVYYFTDFLGLEGPTTLIVPADGTPTLYISELSSLAARMEARGCIVRSVKIREHFTDEIHKALSTLKAKKIGFEALPAHIFLRLEKKLRNVKLQPNSDLVWKLRMVKDATEIAYMRKAAEMADAGVEAAVEALKPGIRECEVAAKAEYEMRSLGSEAFAFNTIVLSGSRTALPHGFCSTRKICSGDLVMIDVGAVYKGYRSDLTRTVVVGGHTRKQSELHHLVLTAQEAAFKAIRAGVKAKRVDSVARNIIRRGGYGRYFVHGLGHGVGLDIHEPPKIDPNNNDVLSENNVITDEPAVYLPKFGGVRIEDTVLVFRDGAERLTKSPREFPRG